MKLPSVSHPERYVGLYVYDFGSHVCIGYTAAEIRFLRESERFKDGAAYEIYRLTNEGGWEMRGVLDERLMVKEALCFLRHEAGAARRDYDTLCHNADTHPLPFAAQALLARVYAFDPPETTALVYDASASSVISTWLQARRFAGGDRVVAGIDVHVQVVGGGSVQIASRSLPTLIDYSDRTWPEIEAAIDRPIQR